MDEFCRFLRHRSCVTKKSYDLLELKYSAFGSNAVSKDSNNSIQADLAPVIRYRATGSPKVRPVSLNISRTDSYAVKRLKSGTVPLQNQHLDDLPAIKQLTNRSKRPKTEPFPNVLHSFDNSAVDVSKELVVDTDFDLLNSSTELRSSANFDPVFADVDKMTSILASDRMSATDYIVPLGSIKPMNICELLTPPGRKSPDKGTPPVQDHKEIENSDYENDKSPEDTPQKKLVKKSVMSGHEKSPSWPNAGKPPGFNGHQNVYRSKSLVENDPLEQLVAATNCALRKKSGKTRKSNRHDEERQLTSASTDTHDSGIVNDFGTLGSSEKGDSNSIEDCISSGFNANHSLETIFHTRVVSVDSVVSPNEPQNTSQNETYDNIDDSWLQNTISPISSFNSAFESVTPRESSSALYAVTSVTPRLESHRPSNQRHESFNCHTIERNRNREATKKLFQQYEKHKSGNTPTQAPTNTQKLENQLNKALDALKQSMEHSPDTLPMGSSVVSRKASASKVPLDHRSSSAYTDSSHQTLSSQTSMHSQDGAIDVISKSTHTRPEADLHDNRFPHSISKAYSMDQFTCDLTNGHAQSTPKSPPTMNRPRQRANISTLYFDSPDEDLPPVGQFENAYNVDSAHLSNNPYINPSPRRYIKRTVTGGPGGLPGIRSSIRGAARSVSNAQSYAKKQRERQRQMRYEDDGNSNYANLMQSMPDLAAAGDNEPIYCEPDDLTEHAPIYSSPMTPGGRHTTKLAQNQGINGASQNNHVSHANAPNSGPHSDPAPPPPLPQQPPPALHVRASSELVPGKSCMQYDNKNDHYSSAEKLNEIDHHKGHQQQLPVRMTNRLAQEWERDHIQRPGFNTVFSSEWTSPTSSNTSSLSNGSSSSGDALRSPPPTSIDAATSPQKLPRDPSPQIPVGGGSRPSPFSYQGPASRPRPAPVAQVQPWCHRPNVAPPETPTKNSDVKHHHYTKATSSPNKPPPIYARTVSPNAHGHPPPLPPKPSSLQRNRNISASNPQIFQANAMITMNGGTPPIAPRNRFAGTKLLTRSKTNEGIKTIGDGSMSTSMSTPASPGLTKYPLNIFPTPLDSSTVASTSTFTLNCLFVDGSTNAELLESQRQELIGSISTKLAELRDMRKSIEADATSNDGLGHNVIEQIGNCEEDEANMHDRSQKFVEKVAKCACLIESINSQIRKVQLSINQLSEDFNPKEKISLEQKLKHLKSQNEDAEMLKSDLHRRGEKLRRDLDSILTNSQMDDFWFYVTEKARLASEMKNCDDKICLGEEKIRKLQNKV